MSKYEPTLDALDRDLMRLLDLVAGLETEQLNGSPGPGKWSISQVLNHLMLSEDLSHQYVKKKLSFNPTLPKAGIKATLRGFFLNLFLKSPIKIGAAKGVRTEDLPEHSELETIKRKWLLQRSELRNYLFTLDSRWDGKEIYKHPLVGRITLPQMLRFFSGHCARHTKQIKRILSSI